MKRAILLAAVLSLILFFDSAPATAQAIVVIDGDETAYVDDHDADKSRLHVGFPALRSPLPEPVYPVRAELFQIEGRVLVEYTVDKRGRAKKVEIVEGPGAGCEDEVRRLLRAARFQPILDVDGTPVAARFRSAFDFRLN